MDADEKEVTTYLKSRPGQYVSGREVARKASGKRRFQTEPHWAVPVLGRLKDKGVIEADASGHYRLVAKSGKEKPKRWISPHIEKLLAKSGKNYSEVFVIEEPEQSGAEKKDEPAQPDVKPSAT